MCAVEIRVVLVVLVLGIGVLVEIVLVVILNIYDVIFVIVIRIIQFEFDLDITVFSIPRKYILQHFGQIGFFSDTELNFDDLLMHFFCIINLRCIYRPIGFLRGRKFLFCTFHHSFKSRLSVFLFFFLFWVRLRKSFCLAENFHEFLAGDGLFLNQVRRNLIHYLAVFLQQLLGLLVAGL